MQQNNYLFELGTEKTIYLKLPFGNSHQTAEISIHSLFIN